MNYDLIRPIIIIIVPGQRVQDTWFTDKWLTDKWFTNKWYTMKVVDSWEEIFLNSRLDAMNSLLCMHYTCKLHIIACRFIVLNAWLSKCQYESSFYYFRKKILHVQCRFTQLLFTRWIFFNPVYNWIINCFHQSNSYWHDDFYHQSSFLLRYETVSLIELLLAL